MHSANSSFDHPHILQSFDEELNQLNDLLLKVANLTLYRLELSIEALNQQSCDKALIIIAQDATFRQLHAELDQTILSILARQCPVASDLRSIVAISKISGELDRINLELSKIARLILELFEPRLGGVNLDLADEIISSGQLVETMLKKLVLSLWNRHSTQAYALLACSQNYQHDLQIGTQRQLAIAASDARLVGRSLDSMEILKAIEHCCEYCRSIAEHLILMFDGEDIRHQTLFGHY
jgi:phosphate transport system protein